MYIVAQDNMIYRIKHDSNKMEGCRNSISPKRPKSGLCGRAMGLLLGIMWKTINKRHQEPTAESFTKFVLPPSKMRVHGKTQWASHIYTMTSIPNLLCLWIPDSSDTVGLLLTHVGQVLRMCIMTNSSHSSGDAYMRSKSFCLGGGGGTL